MGTNFMSIMTAVLPRQHLLVLQYASRRQDADLVHVAATYVHLSFGLLQDILLVLAIVPFAFDVDTDTDFQFEFERASGGHTVFQQ